MNPIHTIGYSGVKIDEFIDHLVANHCTIVCDVRSYPSSRYRPEFSRAEFKRSLNSRGLKYAFFGDALGARPKDRSCYLGGRAEYDRISKQDIFKEALNRLQSGSKVSGLALVCSEADPIECHRAILVSRHLASLVPDIRHIHSNGRIETHQDLEERLIDLYGTAPPPLLRTEAERNEGIRLAYRKQGDAISYSEGGEWSRNETVHDRLH
ncbi:DUF488 family protein [Parablastomonas sp. CN1-191]|uniref:DUF488 domain-containing protein n=1 Tax=Parablastomonas sp. CN1-191 TaxID=3400908 RepID=UPI003BF7CA47